MISGIGQLHTQGLTHTDIRPENVRLSVRYGKVFTQFEQLNENYDIAQRFATELGTLSKQWRVYICDFGCCDLGDRDIYTRMLQYFDDMTIQTAYGAHLFVYTYKQQFWIIYN